ncbi:zinc finger domain-containing protein [Euroglyphus maynei]|uniref:Zinc finger domain-containing protein n=1 Tax=Euroglyphus maynei TaxID=6958 RepID=A0A1Y3BP44_EURMA|nr:zinc finger domain-containing protein [Euroglyphus maynei]
MAKQILNKFYPKPQSWNRLMIRLLSADHQLDKPLSGVDIQKIDEFVDVETHTGQKFEPNDYRLSRFIGEKTKKVNTRFARDLIAEIPPTAVKGRSVACDGGGGPLGHPKVFINLDQPGNHTCGYCGLRFYQEHSNHH